MRRLLILALIALSGCATVYEDRYGYAPGVYAGGDYYYEPTPEPWYDGYNAYDALFWGLRYSYFDPFYYPHFHYGVTFFPRYYDWYYWYGPYYWRWRNYHPYSPYYLSWWDHYYDWHRPPARRDQRRQAYGQRDRGYGNSADDVHRFGSARNAAEYTARLSRPGAGLGTWPATGAGVPRSQAWADRAFPSRGFVPASRRDPADREIGVWRAPAGESRSQRLDPAAVDRPGRMRLPADAGRGRAESPARGSAGSIRGDGGLSGGRSAPAPVRREAPARTVDRARGGSRSER